MMRKEKEWLEEKGDSPQACGEPKFIATRAAFMLIKLQASVADPSSEQRAKHHLLLG
ncbi:hypothetical protein JCM19237_6375 [Photobacterium aphoticum]|uniref:Uncharacterized protein n=1 Tax=Photobacterium aphoticum TaxID=754436 RepID=A0A090QKS4_9GAMM|nr:hypothetical protein JCM19237_6375 [Photobacterium aphoticum]